MDPPHHAAVNFNQTSNELFITLRDFGSRLAFFMTLVSLQLSQMHPVVIESWVVVQKGLLNGDPQVSSNNVGWIVVEGR